MQRSDVVDDLVWQRQQFRAERIDQLAVGSFELRGVHELVALLGQFEQLQLARDALRLRAFRDEIDAALAAVAGGNAAQVFDVREPDLVDRRATPVDLQFAEMPRHGGLIKAEMLGDLCLGGHVYDPLTGGVSTERRGLELPACARVFRGPRETRMDRIRTVRRLHRAYRRRVAMAIANAASISVGSVAATVASAIS